MDPRIKAIMTGYEAAAAAGRTARGEEPRAACARYDAPTRRVVIELTNGCTFLFPVDLGQGLRGADDAELAEVEVLPGGEALHWEGLDADLSVPQMVVGVFGSRSWMRSELERSGGRPTSMISTEGSEEMCHGNAPSRGTG